MIELGKIFKHHGLADFFEGFDSAGDFELEDSTLTRVIAEEELKYGGLINRFDNYRALCGDPELQFLNGPLKRMLSSTIAKLSKARYNRLRGLIRDYISRKLDPSYLEGKIRVIT